MDNARPEWLNISSDNLEGIPINDYFNQHPEMVLGLMVREPKLYGNENETACHPLKGVDFA